ncbi:glycosyl hydrolase family 114 [Streptomyces sp. KhCrAH-43]|uniref:endo alpha-1,4 polygalactosaminidase n=1 Tax=unclassified Streptomyces TaxID=2593676 RepID=UPI00037DCB29|nr:MULTISPECIES: endo alpha-1,4 polygalactosaminidase [unclassified Streptomyces]MYS35195.1 endo alpha-1,4 polygalactosaminidase [Streptomyces sp. SID4920]MYX65028.1 endo alpha-1,4 polygalactosaminidase [Streptomyces sp. SID8373]RAJ65006.1 glycosyl hydrolase family 114 [Streptomyces sp. KhCrAH-43]
MRDRTAARVGGALAVTALMVLTTLTGCSPGHERSPAGKESASARPSQARWQPEPGTDWQWQLSGKLDTSVDAPVYDIDGFDRTAAQVAGLHREGRKVICYLSTGAWEDFRPDAARFPTAVLGKGNGWKGERWLDIRRTEVLEPLMETRIAMCAKKGFDAVEPDNMDGYRNRSGFPLTAADQLRYNRLIARMVHRHGMAVGLKNDLPQIPELVGDFDFAVNEQCAQYEECEELTPFVKAGKAVFHAEYELPAAEFCAQSRKLRLSSLRKEYELDPWRETCAEG